MARCEGLNEEIAVSVRLTRIIDGRSLKVNAWNWGALHALVGALDVFPLEDWEGARHGPIELSTSEVASLCSALRTRILPAFDSGDRMFADGRVATEPDDGTLHRDALERNYSLDHAVLVAILELLEGARGPVRVG